MFVMTLTQQVMPLVYLTPLRLGCFGALTEGATS